jgi:hypothetical protein
MPGAQTVLVSYIPGVVHFPLKNNLPADEKMNASSVDMRFLTKLLILGALVQFSSAQSCSSATTCQSCLNTARTWCASSPDSGSAGCCQFTSSCGGFYPYAFASTCFSYDYDYVYVSVCGTGCIIANTVYAIAWIVNMVVVIKFCKQRNIEPCGFIAIAFFFGVFVWCCLLSRGRQQLVIVQGNIPYQAQTGYSQQPYGQPSYGQPYGGGYAPPAHSSNPYGQASYGQPYGQQSGAPPNPYAQNSSGSGGPPNPYAQPSNPYGEISKPQ